MFSHFSCKGGSIALFEVRLLNLEGTSNNPLGDSFTLFGDSCFARSYFGTFMKSNSFLKSLSTPCLFCYSLRTQVDDERSASLTVSSEFYNFFSTKIVSKSAFFEAYLTRNCSLLDI